MGSAEGLRLPWPWVALKAKWQAIEGNFVGDDGKDKYGDAENKIYALHIAISYVNAKCNLHEYLPNLGKGNDHGR